jgi:uncharacterized membrane protein YdbT with pleckstrin-like domain
VTSRAGDRRYLLPGERVEREVRRHGAVLFRPVIETVGATFLAGFLQRLVSDTAASAVVLLALLLLYLRLLWRIAEWVVERIYLTDRRLFLVNGILTRRVSALPLPKLTDLMFERSPAGRLLGYGKLVVESAGQHQALESVSFIPEPDDFYQDVCRLVFGPLASRSDGT